MWRICILVVKVWRYLISLVSIPSSVWTIHHLFWWKPDCEILVLIWNQEFTLAHVVLFRCTRQSDRCFHCCGKWTPLTCTAYVYAESFVRVQGERTDTIAALLKCWLEWFPSWTLIVWWHRKYGPDETPAGFCVQLVLESSLLDVARSEMATFNSAPR